MPHTAFAPATLGSLTLANHIVMAPLTRSRALGNVPNDLMAEYYGQRATAGLIITEGNIALRRWSGVSAHSWPVQPGAR